MLVYQMIYTACGKDKKGDFSLWSKSNDISIKETDEIIKFMNYRKIKNLPYSPTQEEIDNLFPKSYCFLKLSTNRYCVAKTTYIGKVYSYNDERNGNFIIHAFVFDQLEDFNPFLLHETSMFKTKLTYEEWHDKPVPDSLPLIELENESSVTESFLRSVLSSYGDKFSEILEATLRVLVGNNCLYYVDNEEGRYNIIKALSVFIPASLWSEFTYANQYTKQCEASFLSVGGILVKFRALMTGASYDIVEINNKGNYGFNMLNNSCSTVEVGRYVKDIICDFNTKSYFEVLKKVDNIDAIIKKCNCNVDMANQIYNFVYKKFDWFNDPIDFAKSLELVSQHNYCNIDSYADSIYENIIKNKRWGFGPEILNIIKLVYKNRDIERAPMGVGKKEK